MRSQFFQAMLSSIEPFDGFKRLEVDCDQMHLRLVLEYLYTDYVEYSPFLSFCEQF